MKDSIKYYIYEIVKKFMRKQIIEINTIGGMSMKMSKKILLAMLTTIGILTLSMNVYAYIDGFTSASGTVTVSCGIPEATVEKYEENNIKYFKVSNTGKWDCFVRIKIWGNTLESSMIRI